MLPVPQLVAASAQNVINLWLQLHSCYLVSLSLLKMGERWKYKSVVAMQIKKSFHNDHCSSLIPTIYPCPVYLLALRPFLPRMWSSHSPHSLSVMLIISPLRTTFTYIWFCPINSRPSLYQNNTHSISPSIFTDVKHIEAIALSPSYVALLPFHCVSWAHMMLTFLHFIQSTTSCPLPVMLPMFKVATVMVFTFRLLSPRLLLMSWMTHDVGRLSFMEASRATQWRNFFKSNQIKSSFI